MASMGFPSFFKILVDDFNSLLRIPLLFGKTFEQIMPEDPLLQIKSGQTWFVNIERIDEYYCFTDGWLKFVKDLELKIGDFLVFWLVHARKSIFKVAIYGITGCEKEFNSATTSRNPIKFELPKFKVERKIIEIDPETSRMPRNKGSNTTRGAKRTNHKKIGNRGHNVQISDDSAEDDRCFGGVVSKYHRSRMPVPLRFAKKTGILRK